MKSKDSWERFLGEILGGVSAPLIIDSWRRATWWHVVDVAVQSIHRRRRVQTSSPLLPVPSDRFRCLRAFPHFPPAKSVEFSRHFLHSARHLVPYLSIINGRLIQLSIVNNELIGSPLWNHEITRSRSRSRWIHERQQTPTGLLHFRSLPLTSAHFRSLPAATIILPTP